MKMFEKQAAVCYNALKLAAVAVRKACKKPRQVAVCAALGTASMMLGLLAGTAIAGGWSPPAGASAAGYSSVAEALPGGENAKIYVLKIDSAVVGKAGDSAELLEMLDAILEEYFAEPASLVRFVGDISVARFTVSADEAAVDTQALIELLAQPDKEPERGPAVETVEVELFTEEIPFEIEYIEDDTLFEDEMKIVAEGRYGLALFAETVVRRDGVEQSRDRAAEYHVFMPVTEQVIVGTMRRTCSHGFYIWPASGAVTSGFGFRNIAVGSSQHRGIDIGGRLGDPIFAADGGEVIFAGWSAGGFGNMVRIRHDNGDETLYAHCSKLLVSVGERVYQGQTIARMGSTGVSTGVHLHFELIINGVQIDPMRYLP